MVRTRAGGTTVGSHGRYHQVTYERRDGSKALNALGLDQRRDVVKVVVRPQVVHHLGDERNSPGVGVDPIARKG